MSEITHDNYHEDRRYISSGAIVKYLNHPDKYAEYLRNDLPQLATDAMTFGKACHLYSLLGSAHFHHDYKVLEEGQGLYAKAKAEAIAEGKEAIRYVDHRRIVSISAKYDAIVNRIKRNYNLLDFDEEKEKIITWTHPKNKSVKCKAMLDHLLIDKKKTEAYILDLKTTTDASLHVFKNKIRYQPTSYIIQAIHYINGLVATQSIKKISFIFIAIEKNSPFASNAFYINQDTLHLAEIQSIINYAIEDMTAKELPRHNGRYPEEEIPYDIFDGDINVPIIQYPKEENV
ncbi:MAG: PD-(D/E)XK nuclease-like domain-containing protein [Cytophagales bacterium]|nr:PD-(D/E)XK nuclease-like domain-containing protein [Cytophagales bacterium]